MKVKGNQLKSRVNYLSEKYGPGAWDKVLNALSAEDQSVLRGIITNSAWYPFDLAARLDEAIIEVLGENRTVFLEKLGRASARENLRGVHRKFLEPPDPRTFLQKVIMVYPFYYDSGTRTWEETGPTSGYVITRDANVYSVEDCLTNIGWFKEGLEMCGARNIKIVDEECRAKGGKECRFQISWSH